MQINCIEDIIFLTQNKCWKNNRGKNWPSEPRSAILPPVKAKQSMRPPRRARSESTEDHLERIQELVDRKGYARVTDIADSLGLSKSAVSNMVRRLAARGFVNYEKYRGFTLTPQGQAVASHIKVRHQTLTEMLNLLGLSPDTVQEEVEAIEHHLKPETLPSSPSWCVSGGPIPSTSGLPQAQQGKIDHPRAGMTFLEKKLAWFGGLGRGTLLCRDIFASLFTVKPVWGGFRLPALFHRRQIPVGGGRDRGLHRHGFVRPILLPVSPRENGQRHAGRRRRGHGQRTGTVFTGLMVAGRVGAAIAAEIGTMRVTEQIDALRTLAAHPVDYLVVPASWPCSWPCPC